jgi:hypothetical protein
MQLVDGGGELEGREHQRIFPFVCIVLKDCPLAGDGAKRRAEGHILSQ